MARFQRAPDFAKHALEVLQHVAVLESHHTNSVLRQEVVALAVARLRRLRIVCAAVELYGEMRGGTVEIENEPTDAVLPPEFPPDQLAALKMLPKFRFRGRERRAQLAPSMNEYGMVVELHTRRIASRVARCASHRFLLSPPGQEGWRAQRDGVVETGWLIGRSPTTPPRSREAPLLGEAGSSRFFPSWTGGVDASADGVVDGQTHA